jgi:hypothetical protein
LEGLFLVRVERAFYRWHSQKPFFTLRFAVIEPTEFTGQTITGRIYCSLKALWKLNCFLRDFGYDQDLLGRDEVDEKALLGLCGVLRVPRAVVNEHSFLNLDGFAPKEEWEDVAVPSGNSEEARRDL